MSFYVDGSGYAQQAGATFTYGTFQQPQAAQQVIDTSAYGYGGANMTADGSWQMQQANAVPQQQYQQMAGQTAVAGHQVHQQAAASNYGPIGGPILRQGQGMQVGRGHHMAGGHGRGGYHQPHQNMGGYGAQRGGRGGHRGRGGMYGANHNANQGPKPIKATEIKSYLYAWCTQKKLKPEYSYEPQGRSPKVRYLCNLSIPGIDFKASEEARSKREAQTAAAWSFCNEMVRKNYMKQQDLPLKEDPLVGAQAAVAGPTQPTPEQKKEDLKAASAAEAAQFGGWTIDNSRQRLNRFCMSERISCDFENIVEGTVNKTTIARLELQIRRLAQPLVVQTRASNKKQANASCAVLAVRALFKNNLIEKFGDRIMNLSMNRQSESGVQVESVDIKMEDDSEVKQGTKRKADEPLEFDANGNWTLETARAKLQDFYAINGKDLVFDEQEIGTLQDRQYQFSVSITVESKSIAAAALATNKKSAQKKCALDMVIQLYQNGLIEGNTGKRIKPRQGPSAIKRAKTSVIVHGGPFIMPNPRVIFQVWGNGRTTPFDDRHIRAKVEELEQSKEDKQKIASIVEDTEKMLKTIGEKLSVGLADTERVLHSVIRMGSFPKGTMLKGETLLEMILLFKHKPTIKNMTEVFCMLKEHELASNFVIEQDCANAMLRLTKAGQEGSTYVMQMYISSDEYAKLDEMKTDPDPVDILPSSKCLEYLTRLRQAQFFQSCAHPMPNTVPVARVFKNLIASDSTWGEFSSWATELLVEKAAESAPYPCTAGDLIRRVFTSLACGLLLPGNPGLADPTNKNEDTVAHLTRQEREDITYKAQHALRLIAFNQVHVVLGIDKIERTKHAEKATTETKPDELNGVAKTEIPALDA